MKKSNLWLVLTFSLILAAGRATAHEGHGIPGALPPGPHGGVVAESGEAGGHSHEQGHDHDHGGDEHLHEHLGDAKPKPHAHVENEKEYFFEAVFKDGKVKVYPLTFGANTSTFVVVSPKTMKNVVLRAEVPRKKLNEVLKTTLTDESIEAAYDAKKANRFLVHVAAEIDGKALTSKLQIEKNK